MSTSFYWIHDAPEAITIRATGEKIPFSIDGMDPAFHIGVRRGGNFTFAQDPVKVQLICEKYPDDNIIKDEYGDKLTGKAFLEIINELNHITNMVGEWFG